MARKTSFYYSFLVLAPERRRAIGAVWDFCRAVDDSVDEAPSDGRPAAREALCGWRGEIARCFGSGDPQTREGRGLRPFVEPFHLPRAAFEDVIDGVAMDLETTRYETFDDLFEYCRRVASAVGMICIEVFGCQSPRSREYALNLGVALQLTNILRDVKDDLARGRVYLPLEDLRACSCTVEALGDGAVTEPVRRLMELECRRAHEFYRRAMEARPIEDRPRLLAAEIMRAVYFETLTRIEMRGYDVFAAPVRVPRATQALIALQQWIWRP